MKTVVKTTSSIIAVLLVLAIAFGAGFYVGRHPADNAEEIPKTEKEGIDLQLPGETEKMVVTVDEVKAKIREIGELSSSEGRYTITKGEDFIRYFLDNIPIPGTTAHIELTCTGIVKAGYNLNDVITRIDESSKTIYVSLPDIISTNWLLWDESMICNEKNNIFNPIEFSQYQSLITAIKEEGFAAAVKEGLYETAESNAKNVIKNFLGCFVDYAVEFM